MAGRLRAVVLLLALAGSPALAQVDPNFQALLNALMQGTQVALISPLPDGTLQVTSFTAPGQRSAAEAAALIEQARLTLSNFGVQQPTGQQLAVALAGGTLSLPTGSTQIVGVLPTTPTPATLNTQIVNASGLPQVVTPLSPGGVGAAAGGTAPSGALARLTPAQQTQALQLAHSQLAALGITNPTPQQVAAMLNGGTIATPSGTMVLPGLISGQPAQAPIVSPLPPSSTAAPSTTPIAPSATPTPFIR